MASFWVSATFGDYVKLQVGMTIHEGIYSPFRNSISSDWPKSFLFFNNQIRDKKSLLLIQKRSAHGPYV